MEINLDKINRYSRRALKAEEVYCFPVVLCDNDIDRDGEKFTVSALKKLAELFIGKTGIFNHDPRGENQTARIYETEVITDPDRKTADGEPYTCLRANAYMVRTSSNEDLIREIDGGIKKEVSVGCAISRETCSVCHKNRRQGDCAHKNGRTYNGRLCYTLLDEPTDAYEWSFVAVPAQKAAGVTKRYSGGSEKQSPEDSLMDQLTEDLKKDVIRLSYAENSSLPAEMIGAAIEKMAPEELLKLKRELSKKLIPGRSELEKAIEKSVSDRPDAKSAAAFRI